MVTGGLAVMKHFFRDQLSNIDLVRRLFATADKSGIYADRDVYGQGLLDLGAATSSVGALGVALAERVDGPVLPLAETAFASGVALGDGLAQALSGQEIAGFDTLGAPFWFLLDALIDRAPRRFAATRLRALMAPEEDGEPGVFRPRFAPLAAGPAGTSVGFIQAPSSGAPGGHLSLVGRALALGAGAPGGLDIAAFSTEGMPGQSPTTGAALSWRPDGALLGLTSGWVAERETMLASSSTGAFGRLSGASAFAGIEGRVKMGVWRIDAGIEIGTVRATASGGMIATVSSLTTSAFAFTAGRELAGGHSVEFSASQPLRVESGRARLSVPVGRSKDGRVLRRSLSAGLAPSGRQIDFAARWRRTFRTGGALNLGAALTHQPGHDAAARPDLSLLAGWRHAF